VIIDALTRRELVAVGIAALLRDAIARGAEAKFPTRNIQFIIPYAAGGGFDAYVRFVSPVMEQYLPARASIVPANIAAASGSRGISQLYRAKPDGYTIGIFDLPGMFIEQAVQGNNAYDLSKFAWIGCIGEGEHYLLAVGANSPIKTYADLQALSAKRPVKFSSTGIEGTATAATIIATEVLGIRRQLITGYRGSSDYIIAAIRGAAPHHCFLCPAQLHSRHSRCDNARQTGTRSDHGRTPCGRCAGNAASDPEHPFDGSRESFEGSQSRYLGGGERCHNGSEDAAGNRSAGCARAGLFRTVEKISAEGLST